MSVIWLYTGAAALVVAAITILGYEVYAWRSRKKATISTMVRRWDALGWKRKAMVFAAITVVGQSIQFLAIHFVFPVG